MARNESDPADKPEPGEFTRMFQAPATPVAPSAGEVLPVQSPSPETIEPRSPSQPGEFTQLFQRPPLTPAKAAPAPAPVDDRTRLFPAPAAASGEDSFTKQFFNQPAPPKPAMPSPAPESAEFDNFHDSPYASNPALIESREVRVVPKPQAPPAREEGDFTRLFGLPGQPAPKPAPMDLKGNATGLFRPSAEKAPAANTEPASRSTDYERIFQRPAVPAPAKAPPASAPKPPLQATRQNQTLLIVAIVLGVLLLIALMVIIILLLHR